jgi:putative radical SAM enzyme (TIGR03279 family)
MPKITSLSKTAKRCGFKLNDEVTTLGGFPFIDILDYLYFDTQPEFSADIVRNGKPKSIKVKKGGGSLDLEFDLELKPRVCKNKCVFCFVDQLPKGLRETLYVKDDDYRLSFISGCYVTLTNLSEQEIERIIRLKLSPIYISVHAFDDKTRLRLLKNPQTLKLIDIMRRLGEAGIAMHTQLVVVPGVNDGAELTHSIEGLRSVPGVETVAVVPVGLTGHRTGLDELRPVTPEEAISAVRDVERLNAGYGGGFVWCADEYYLLAGLPLPSYGYSGSFSQIENGVGLVADFEDNFNFSLSDAEVPGAERLCGKRIGFITGASFATLLTDYARLVDKKFGTKSRVFAIRNTFFGESVTVAGLVTAGDIMSQISPADAAGTDVFVAPDNMLREFTDRFLDNRTLNEIEHTLSKKVLIASHTGTDVVRKLIDYFSE